MRIFIALLCVTIIVLPPMLYGEEDLKETARLGSVTYNISVQFWEDGIGELTPVQRKAEIKRLSFQLTKGELNPLQIYELVRLLALDGRTEDEEKTVELLAFKVDSILALDPKNHEALVASVKLDLREGNTEIFSALLADSALQDETYRSLLIELANLHAGRGNYEKAEEVISYVVEFDSLDTEAMMMKASIRATSMIFSLLTQGFMMLAEEFEQIDAKDRLPTTVSRINEEYNEIDFSPLERALKRDPDNFEFHCFAGSVKGFIIYLHYMVLMGVVEEEDSLPLFTEETMPMLKEVRESLEEALKTRPEGDIDVFMALAMHYIVVADYAMAREYAEKAIEARPELDEPYDALITVINFQRQAVEGDVEGGFRESIEVIERKKQHKSLQLIDLLMQLHPLVNEGRYEDALAGLKPIEEKYPDELSLMIFKGGILLRTGKVEEALAVLASAKMMDPKSEDILYDLGLAHVLKEQYGEAKVYLEAAHEVDPSDEEIGSLLEKVNAEFK
jgi:tetratricopeptide (TPR) repeat protein